MKEHKMKAEMEEDRLSALSDSLMSEVMSMLPIQSAAATSLISRRWRYQWTHLTTTIRIRFGNEDLECSIRMVDDILSRLTSPLIRIFDVEFGCHRMANPDAFSSSKLESWVSQVCARNGLEVFKLKLPPQDYPDVSPSHMLPGCIFHTPSLVELYLWIGRFEINFSGNQGVCLPNLKKLTLRTLGKHSSNSELGRILFKSCPLLEYLFLDISPSYGDQFIKISFLNLKSLFLDIYGISPRFKVVIDAPKLQLFECGGHLPTFDFVEIPTRLVSVSIVAGTEADIDSRNDPSFLYGLLRGISYARSIYFSGEYYTSFGSHDADVVPTFHHLADLGICCMEVIEWKCTSPLPLGILAKVKRIKIRNLYAKDEIQMVEYFLKNAPNLEHLTLYTHEFRDFGKDELWNECKFCKALSKISKRYQRCKIEFFGRCFTTSTTSPDLRKGLLGGDVNCLWYD